MIYGREVQKSERRARVPERKPHTRSGNFIWQVAQVAAGEFNGAEVDRLAEWFPSCFGGTLENHSHPP